MASTKRLDNLVPATKETAAERGKAGGLKAAEGRRKKKQLKDCMQAILELPAGDRQKQKLAALGIDSEIEMSNQMVVAASMFFKAANGDVRAAEYIRDLTEPESKLDKARIKLLNAQTKQILAAQNQATDLSKLDELLSKIDTIAEEPDDETIT